MIKSKKNKGFAMADDLLKYLPYILPLNKTNSDEQCISITSQSFMTLYGDVIQDALRDMGLLKKSEQQIEESELDHAVSVITEYIETSKHDCFVWDAHSKLIMFSSEKMKPDGFKVYLKQKQENKISPNKFMIAKKQPASFNEKCVIGMLFQSFLILFDKLLTQVRTNETDIKNTLANARLFNIVDTTNQANTFIHAFFNRRSYKKGAMITSNTKRNVRNYVNKVIKKLGITEKDMTKINIPITLQRIKQEYKHMFKKTFPYSDKTLENWVIEVPKSQKF